MLPSWTDCWSVGLILLSVHHARTMSTVSSTDGGCYVSVSFMRQDTYTKAVPETVYWGFWFLKKSRKEYRSKSFTKYVIGTKQVPCNASTIGILSGTQTPPSITGVKNSSESNDSSLLFHQRDEQPSPGQMAVFIIGIIALVAVVAGAIVVVAVFIRRHRNRNQSPSSGKSSKQTASPSETSEGAVVYYEPAEVIRDRKRRQREANQDATDLSDKTESQDQMTGLDDTVYSYNHLREANDLQGGSQLVTNTCGHLQDGYRAKTENEAETSLYYNLEANPLPQKRAQIKTCSMIT